MIDDTVFPESAVGVAVVSDGVINDSTGDSAMGHCLDGVEVRWGNAVHVEASGGEFIKAVLLFPLRAVETDTG